MPKKKMPKNDVQAIHSKNAKSLNDLDKENDSSLETIINSLSLTICYVFTFFAI